MGRIRFVVLANSSKKNDVTGEYGRCIAGKDLDTNKWLRLGALSRSQEDDPCIFNSNSLMRASNSVQGPLPLSIWEIRVLERRPKKYHPEDCIVGNNWRKIGFVPKDSIKELFDLPPYGVFNWPEINKIPIEAFDSNPLRQSLNIFELTAKNSPMIKSVISKNHPRFQFKMNGNRYNMSITDPNYRKDEELKPRFLDKIYVAFGLTEPYKGFCYRLALTIFEEI